MTRAAAKFFVVVTVVTLALSPFGNNAYANHVPGHTATQPPAAQGQPIGSGTQPPGSSVSDQERAAINERYEACVAGDVLPDLLCATYAGFELAASDYNNGAGAFAESLCSVLTFDVDAVWCMITYVVMVVYWIVSAFLWLAAVLYDTVIRLLVVEMGQYVHTDVVQAAWKIIRNLVNLGIIAGFVAVGISTILQTGYKADQWLAKLIIAALLVNFSFFFAGAMIDASNFVASAIYEEQILKGLCDGSLPTACVGSYASPSTAILALLKLGSVENLKAFAMDDSSTLRTADGSQASPALKYVLLGLVGIGLMVGLMIIFFVTAFLLISRFVALILLLITSPIGIAGINIPYISEKIAGKWWGEFTSQVLFAPVYLLLLAISLSLARVLSLVQASSASGVSRVPQGFWEIASGDAGLARDAIILIVQYIVVVVFMYLSLSIARSMSKEATQFKPVYDWVGGIGRNTVGRMANRFRGIPGMGILAKQDFGGDRPYYKDKTDTEKLLDALKNRGENSNEGKGSTPPQTRSATGQPLQDVTKNNGRGGAQPTASAGQKQKPGNKIGWQVPEGAGTGTRAQWYRAVAGQAGEQVKSGIRRIGSAIGLGGNKPPTADEGFKTHEEAQKGAAGGANTQTPPSQPPTTPPTPPPQSAPNTTALAAGPSSGAALPPELQGRLDGAAQTHVGIQLVGQVQGHSETIAGEMRNAGVAEAIIGSTTQAHNDHLESLRKLREKSANDQEHNDRVNAANAALKRIEDRESTTMSQISERIGRLQGELSSAARPSSVGGVASTPQDQKVEKAQMEIRSLEQGLNRIKGAQADRRTAHSLVIGNAKPTTKI